MAVSTPWVLGSAGPAKLGAQHPIAVVGGTLIDGNGGVPIPDAVIVIRGNRIVSVGQAGDIPVPERARVIDASGKTVMPSLADMHVHFVGGWDGQRTDMLGYQRYLDGLLYAGVTTIFDTGNVLPFIIQIRDELAAGRLRGPRVYAVGPVIDGPDPVWPPISYSVGSIAQIDGIVRQLKGAGVDMLKGYGGLSIPMVQTLVREAHEDTMRVVVDHWAQNGSVDLMRAGVLAFAHLPASPITNEALQLMVENEVSFLTTLTVYESFSQRRLADLGFLQEDLIAGSNPRWALDELTELAKRAPSEQERASAESSAESLAHAKRNVKQMWDAGVLIAAGTDAPYPGVFLGEGLHRELELLVEAGLTPLQAITAATRNAAAFLRAEDDWGSLEAGKLANLLVIDGNPSRQISDTRRIDLVIKEGVVLDRESLRYDPAKDPGFRATTSVSGN